LVIGEIIDDGVLLPVAIRGEVPGRVMRAAQTPVRVGETQPEAIA
jgi:hypothetical protein